MPLAYKQNLEFDKIDYKKEVNEELESGRELNAFLLIHGYIEAYLRDWLFVTGPIQKNKFSKEIISNIDRMGFYNLLHVHVILGHIDKNLYSKIRELNEKRNSIAHRLIIIDTNNTKTKKYLKKIVLSGIDVCGEVFKLYRKTLDEKQHMLDNKL